MTGDIAAFVRRSSDRSDAAEPNHSNGMQTGPEMSFSGKSSIVILGMHRSGTSALARLCGIAGGKLPTRMVGADHGNELGHWEPAGINKLNDSTLQKLGRAWYDWRPLDWDVSGSGAREGYLEQFYTELAFDFEDIHFAVIKEPRLCVFADAVLPALAARGVTSKIILPVRNPIEVCHSLKKRDQLSFESAALLWLRYTLLAEQASRSHDRSFVLYDDLLLNWLPEMNRISVQANINWPVQLDSIDDDVTSFLDAGRRHHTATEDQISQCRITRDWIYRTYASMKSFSQNPHSSEAMIALNSVNKELNNAIPFLGAFYSRQPEEPRAKKKRYKIGKSISKRLGVGLSRLRSKIDTP